MELKDILGNLNDEQIKELKEAINSNPNVVVELLQTSLDEKDAREKERIEREKIESEEREKRKIEQEQERKARSKIQRENAEMIFFDFDKVKMELKTIFNEATSNNENKDLITKLHDRLTTIVIDYMILKAYNYEVLDLEHDKFELEYIEAKKQHKELPQMDPEIAELRSFSCLRIEQLESQYRLLSYIYGELIGLSDEDIINRGLALKDFYTNTMFVEILNNGKSIRDYINDFYMHKYNGRGFGCVRDMNNKLSYPGIGGAAVNLSFGSANYDSEFLNTPEAKKYYPFTNDRLKQLFNEINMPYYEKIGAITGKNAYKEMSVTDGYKDDTGYYDRVFLGNEYEYNITEQLVNEYLSQKETNKQL